MKNNKLTTHLAKCIIGTVLIAAGIMLAVFYTVPHGNMQALPFVLGGMGLVAFVGGLSGALTARIMRKDPDLAKQLKDFYDERAIMLENKAKAKTSDFTTVLLWALLIFFAVMQVQALVIWVFLGAMLVRMFLELYLVNIYYKRM